MGWNDVDTEQMDIECAVNGHAHSLCIANIHYLIEGQRVRSVECRECSQSNVKESCCEFKSSDTECMDC